METEKYIYIWIRRDIPIVAQIIQGMHATDRAAMNLDYYYEKPANMVLFEVEDEMALLRVAEYLKSENLQEVQDFTMFYDNAWPLGYNSIATRPFLADDEDRQIFADFTLYRGVDDNEESASARAHVHVTD